MSTKACIFDVFGTLVDWRESVSAQLSKAFSMKGIEADPHAVVDAWRGRYQPSMAPIRDGTRPYVALDDLHRENLEFVLAGAGIARHFDEGDMAEMAHYWERLEPWPDVVSGLTALRQKAIIAPCSNGSIALMTRLARHAALPWDCILGAEIAQSYKPNPAVYRACCDALRLPPEEVMMVAAHNDDLRAARECGLKTAFIARPTEYGPGQKADLQPEEDWDRVVTSIGDLAG